MRVRVYIYRVCAIGKEILDLNDSGRDPEKRVCVCVCVCVRQRQRARERESVCVHIHTEYVPYARSILPLAGVTQRNLVLRDTSSLTALSLENQLHCTFL